MGDPLSVWELLAGGLFILALAFLAYKSKAIDFLGAAAGVVVTFITFVGGGVRWLMIMVAFFVTSSVLTRFHYNYKQKLGSAQEKGGTRSWPNTLANGSISAAIAFAEYFSHQDLLVIAFLTSVAAAMSDTIATEIGLLSPSKPRLISNLSRTVEPGTSGGVTPLGEAVSFGSSLGIALLGALFAIVGRGTSISIVSGAISIVVGGVFGSTFDSILGATVQGSRRCVVCGALTENRRHHGKEATLVKGLSFIDNNVVNFLGILSGVVVSVVVYVLIK